MICNNSRKINVYISYCVSNSTDKRQYKAKRQIISERAHIISINCKQLLGVRTIKFHCAENGVVGPTITVVYIPGLNSMQKPMFVTVRLK